MPEHLKALVYVLMLATVVFAFAKVPACTVASTVADFKRRRNLWYAITLTAFLANDFWLYTIAVAALLLLSAPREQNKIAMFFFLLFALPAIPAQITGLGVIDHVFTINYIRLLTLTVLLPAFLQLLRQSDAEPFGRTLPDKLLASYLVLEFFLYLSATSLTNALRAGVFYAFIDVFLPYYVASRSLRSLQAFRDTLMALVIGAMVLGAIGVIESSKGWLLYSALPRALGVEWDTMFYLLRGDTLRAVGTSGHSIPMGYVMAVGMGFLLFLRQSVGSQAVWVLGLSVLLAGMIATLARGPWVGAAAMFVVFMATSPHPERALMKFGVVVVVLVATLLVSPLGYVVVNHLPFLGGIDAGSITYRQRLLEISVQVIMQNPFFGSSNYYAAPEMQELMQGQGIIDIVNTYVGVALWSGLTGLTLFVSFFFATVLSIVTTMRNVANKTDERFLLGRALLSTILGIMVIIFTVSSITVIPVVYWSVAGLGIAYVRMRGFAGAPVGGSGIPRQAIQRAKPV